MHALRIFHASRDREQDRCRDSGGSLTVTFRGKQTWLREREYLAQSVGSGPSGAKVQTVRACQIDRFIYIAKVAREKFKDWMAPFCLRIILDLKFET